MTGIAVWSDANDDQQQQPDEVHSYKKELGGWISGWYMPMTQSLINYGTRYRLAPTGWTACGAPIYDASSAKEIVAPADLDGRGGMGAQLGCGSEDGKLMVYNSHYGAAHSDLVCFDIDTGQLKWRYPSNYVGVHGGHLAPPGEVGLIRAAYDIVGSVRLPDPIGNVFVIATDKGEWHLINGDGFYLSSLFQADALKIQWPNPATPGAIMDNVPPGMGAEDFGGSISATKDGQLYIQAGKTAFINIKVVGLDALAKLGHGEIAVGEADLALARAAHNKLAQLEAGEKLVNVPHKTIRFTGDPAKDFGDSGTVKFNKGDARVVANIAYDGAKLYLAWTVDDASPWVNGATDAISMYAKGDTVDFQLAADPRADGKLRGSRRGGFAAVDRQFPGQADRRALSADRQRQASAHVLFRHRERGLGSAERGSAGRSRYPGSRRRTESPLCRRGRGFARAAGRDAGAQAGTPGRFWRHLQRRGRRQDGPAQLLEQPGHGHRGRRSVGIEAVAKQLGPAAV